ncbi:MAG: hypothetical protein JXR63_00835 [Spirochaetales bacterium]|nr:hypothetical protein [Spirochaetales bacterium]
MTRRGEVEFESGDAIFREHFPGNPVVPGSFLIDFFVEKIKEDCRKCRFFTIEKFKFIKFLQPAIYEWEIEGRDGGKFICLIRKDGIIFSKGTITVGK